MLAEIFVQRDAEKNDPGVGFNERGRFARAEADIRGDTAAAQKKTKRDGLL